MITERFRAVMDTVVQLPSEAQDRIAAAIEETLKQFTQPAPPMSPDTRAEYERVLPDLAASLAYLKDR